MNNDTLECAYAVFTAANEPGGEKERLRAALNAVMGLRCLVDDVPTGKFVALYADGSGAGVFCIKDGRLLDSEGDSVCSAGGVVEHLLDCGYLHWLPLPDDFKIWFEEFWE